MGGLTVSMQAAAPAATSTSTGRFETHLTAENSTGATMTLSIVGNPPQLLDVTGSRVTSVSAMSGYGPGARNTGPGANPRTLRPKPGSVQELGPHKTAVGVLITRFDTTGRNYSVKWDFGPGRIATFRLP